MAREGYIEKECYIVDGENFCEWRESLEDATAEYHAAVTTRSEPREATVLAKAVIELSTTNNDDFTVLRYLEKIPVV